jgi:4,5-dihydroxyphthalate decarboxylase
MSEPAIVNAVLADYPHTRALKSGDLTDPAVRLHFSEVNPVHEAFAPMVRDEAYDLSELAIVTCLQAIAYDRPVVLLPVVVASRFQRGCLIAHASRGIPKPDDLEGKRIGVRAYTQTTGMWVRAHLAEDYGLRPGAVHWATRDGAHVEQYSDPAYVEHSVGDKALVDLLRDGDVDAIVLGNDLPQGDEFVPVISDAAERDQSWWQQHDFMPINHMVVAARSLCRRDANAVRAAYRLLRHSDAEVARSAGEPTPTMFGFDRLTEPMAFIIDACMAQDLLPHELTVDDVFGPARDILGDLGR